MLKYIAKGHNKSLPKLLTEWSLQEYREHEKSPFYRNLKSKMGRYKKKILKLEKRYVMPL